MLAREVVVEKVTMVGQIECVRPTRVAHPGDDHTMELFVIMMVIRSFPYVPVGIDSFVPISVGCVHSRNQEQ